MTEELHPEIQRLMDDLQDLSAGHKNTDPTAPGIERLRQGILALQRETAAHVRFVMLRAAEQVRAERAEARVTKLREGILEARKEGCACDFHLYAEDKDLLNDALLDVYLTQEQANREARAEAERYRAALDRVWDALTAEDKRGAFSDTLWMPDNPNLTVFEFIDQTLNPMERT